MTTWYTRMVSENYRSWYCTFMFIQIHVERNLKKIQAESFLGFLNVICFNPHYCDVSVNSTLTSQPMQNLPEIAWSGTFNVLALVSRPHALHGAMRTNDDDYMSVQSVLPIQGFNLWLGTEHIKQLWGSMPAWFDNLGEVFLMRSSSKCSACL